MDAKSPLAGACGTRRTTHADMGDMTGHDGHGSVGRDGVYETCASWGFLEGRGGLRPVGVSVFSGGGHPSHTALVGGNECIKVMDNRVGTGRSVEG